MNLARALLALIAIPLAAAPAVGQRPAGGGPGGPPDHPGFGGPRLDEVKDALNASTEQWTLLEPKIRRIQELRHEVSGSGQMGGVMGGPGSPPPGGPDHHGPPSAPGPDDDASRDGPAPKAPPATRPAHTPPLAAFAEHRPHDDQHFDQHASGPADNGPHRSDVQDKLDDLSDALDQNAKDDEITAKIEALHQARAKAKGELDKSQHELRGMLDARQQAILITMGVLD